jgi:UDP-N-acetylmuramate dehydrogenase
MINTSYYQDLTKMNTFGMKVKARCFMEYDSVADLVDIEFSELARPVLHIGGGSNLLFTDDFKGTILHSKIDFIEILEDCPDSHPEPSSDCHFDRASDCHFDRAERVEKSVLVSVGAGTVFDDFCAWAAKEGLWGVENLSYIPGEVGASAVQNIGAYGVEVKDVIRRVYCYDTVEEEFVNFSVEECEYGYRDSIFKDPEIKGRYIVTHVVFALSRTPQPKLDYGHLKVAVETQAGVSDCHPERSEGSLTPALIRKVIIKIRKEKLPEPSVMGSAGSFFKNPVISAEHFARIEAAAKAEHGPDYKVPHYVVTDDAGNCHSERSEESVKQECIKLPAAWLIEQCGWKGKRSGGAAVWEKQPLVIVNYTGNAYPEEIIGLERRIIASVKAKFDIELHPEVDHI